MPRALSVGIGHLLVLCFIPFASAYALTADEEARTVSYVKALLDCKLTLGDYEKKDMG